MCLCPNAHKYWEKAHFALKPIGLSDDMKRLDMQFFWLAKGNYTSKVHILQRPLLPVDLNQGPNVTMLYNVQTRKEVCSGDKISLETDDPVLHPLPNLRLLEMQWFLNRVAAMSGAAEPQDDFGDDGDDGDDDLPMATQKKWDLYMEDEWDVDMDPVPDTDIGESSSSLITSSSPPIPSLSSPQRLVPQHLFAQLPEDEKTNHTATTFEREGPKEFS
jgi:hypothetical protein